MNSFENDINNSERQALRLVRELIKGTGEYKEIGMEGRINVLLELKGDWIDQKNSLRWKGDALQAAKEAIEHLTYLVKEGKEDPRIRNNLKNKPEFPESHYFTPDIPKEIDKGNDEAGLSKESENNSETGWKDLFDKKWDEIGMPDMERSTFNRVNKIVDEVEDPKQRLSELWEIKNGIETAIIGTHSWKGIALKRVESAIQQAKDEIHYMRNSSFESESMTTDKYLNDLEPKRAQAIDVVSKRISERGKTYEYKTIRTALMMSYATQKDASQIKKETGLQFKSNNLTYWKSAVEKEMKE